MNLRSVFFKTIIVICMACSYCYASITYEIKGVNSDIEKNILAYLTTSNINCQSSVTQIDQFLEKVPKKINSAIRPFGYYQATIISNKQRKNKECWKVNFSIDLGQPIIINQIDINLSDQIKNNDMTPIQQPIFPFKNGDILLHSQYENYKSQLIELASENGFLDARFIKQQIDIYPSKYEADIVLDFHTGARYKINDITIVQSPQFLSNDFILKLLSIKKGQYFTNSKLFNLRKKLANTGYFDKVSVEIDYDNKNAGQVPLIISLTPGDRIKYSTGIGFSTDEGARVLLDYNRARISDFGYQFNSKLNLSEVISELSIGFKMPSKSNPIQKWYNVETGFRRERTDTASSDIIKLGLSQTRIHENKWQNINYIDLIDEKFINGEVQNESVLLIPGTSWSYTKADNPRIPMEGFKIQADIKAATNAVISDVSFAQFNLSYKTIYPIKNKNRLIYRGQIGTTLINDLSLLPSSYRFYTGGDSSIRGYNFNTISPRNDDGDAIGAKNLFISSLEYEQRIGQQWGVAVFTDVGSAFSDKFKLKKSVGVGARWFSPIGPIRLDLGFPINDDDNNFQIHITVGPDF